MRTKMPVISKVSEYLALTENERSKLVARVPVEVRGKAVALRVDGDHRLAWFPRSCGIELEDDYYNDKADQWLFPLWLVERKAAELGVLPWRI